MLLSAVSVLVVAQSSSEIPEGLMNNPVYRIVLSVFWTLTTLHEDPDGRRSKATNVFTAIKRFRTSLSWRKMIFLVGCRRWTQFLSPLTEANTIIFTLPQHNKHTFILNNKSKYITFDTQKSEVHLRYTNSYLTKNTVLLIYTEQPVSVVYGNDRHLPLKSYEIHVCRNLKVRGIYSYSCFFKSWTV